MRAVTTAGAVLALGIALSTGAFAAPGSSAPRIYRDPRGDACCTEDITRVAVSAEPRRIIFQITALPPLGPQPAATSDRFIPITTGRGARFQVGTSSDGPGYELDRWSVQLQKFVHLAPVHISVRNRGTLFVFTLSRRVLGNPGRFTFSVEFWAVTSFGGANYDFAPDRGSWSYRVPPA
jgi:hypothetical protein